MKIVKRKNYPNGLIRLRTEEKDFIHIWSEIGNSIGYTQVGKTYKRKDFWSFLSEYKYEAFFKRV